MRAIDSWNVSNLYSIFPSFLNLLMDALTSSMVDSRSAAACEMEITPLCLLMYLLITSSNGKLLFSPQYGQYFVSVGICNPQLVQYKTSTEGGGGTAGTGVEGGLGAGGTISSG